MRLPFLSDIRHIKQRDPAARSWLEIITCYPGLHAIWLHRVAHFLWRLRLYWFARLISHVSRFFTAIEIHPGAQIGQRVFIDHGHGVVIGETAIVADDCTIYQGVTLGGTALTRGQKRHPTLEQGVIVGAGAKILGAFTVGEYAKVGSNAVVTKAVMSHTTVVGNPAHEITTSTSSVAGTAFVAYGVSAGQEDPIICEIQLLQQQVASLQAQLASLEIARKSP